MPNNIILDERLKTVEALFPSCVIGADIGADHGRLSGRLLESGKVKEMIVSDISADSLDKARALLSKHGLSERAFFRVADGLDALDRPVEAIAICGVGGNTLASILARSAQKLKGASLLLSPHTEAELVRKTLMNLSYHIDQERIALARGKYYVVIRAEAGYQALDERALYIGPEWAGQADARRLEYMQKCCQRIEKARGNEAERKRAWLKEEIERVKSACSECC